MAFIADILKEKGFWNDINSYCIDEEEEEYSDNEKKGQKQSTTAPVIPQVKNIVHRSNSAKLRPINDPTRFRPGFEGVKYIMTKRKE